MVIEEKRDNRKKFSETRGGDLIKWEGEYYIRMGCIDDGWNIFLESPVAEREVNVMHLETGYTAMIADDEVVEAAKGRLIVE